jgi:hypothetical protein
VRTPFIAVGVLALGCGRGEPPADLLLVGARVYTMTWPDPAPDGTPAADAPHDATGWHPDAQAVAIAGGRILYVGTDAGARRYQGPATRVIELGGATVLPGLIDAHTHNDSYAEKLSQVDLVGAANEAEAVDRVAAWVRDGHVPAGRWVVGYGWDDGAWSNHYPTLALLSRRVPNHPVVLRGLHGFAIWGNRLAMERAGITPATPSPPGGEILKGQNGQPTGVLKDRAVTLLASAVPPTPLAAFEGQLIQALDSMAAAGIVQVTEADVGAREMEALQALARAGRLPVRVHALLRTQGPNPDTAYLARWLARGPDKTDTAMLVVQGVKAFYDGALGSRGAWLLEDYSDKPGVRGTGGASYGFNREWVARFARAGFQVEIHAIGDAANRATLDFLDSLEHLDPSVRDNRNRIAHAQVVAAGDFPRLAPLGIIASMQPGHAMDDMGWAEDRVGPARIRGAYAWRRMREAGARLVFSSDLPGADYHVFAEWHAAVTRTNAAGEPRGGWYPAQRMTPEEAVRAYTTWAAYASFRDSTAGRLASGRWADVTIMDVGPLALAPDAYARILGGQILYTIVRGRVVYDRRAGGVVRAD